MALIGPNGAGKTTLFDCLSGVQEPDGGRVHFDGVDLTGLSQFERSRLGLARTFQRIELFAGLTVRDHLLVADRAQRLRGAMLRDLTGRSRPTADELARCDAVLERVGLTDDADRAVETLSLGRGRVVELARALVCRPRLLFLDEPSSGLDHAEASEMAGVLEEVQRERDVAIVLCEHDVAFVERLAHADLRARRRSADRRGADPRGAAQRGRAHRLPGERGMTAPPRDSVAGARVEPPAEPPAEPAGDPSAAASARREPDAARPVLELDRVSAGYRQFKALFDVSLQIGAGSAVALIGHNGVGKTTVARVASGLVEPTAGSVRVEGHDLTGRHPYEFARAGVAHAPEGRSVFATLTVEENLLLPFQARFGRNGMGPALAEAYEHFPILAERRKQNAGSLSGGEQRMLTLARVLVMKPKVLIADELSLGLAPIITKEVYRVLAKIRSAGTALLVIEQHVDHAMALADRIVVLERGEVTYRGAPDDPATMAAVYPRGEEELP